MFRKGSVLVSFLAATSKINDDIYRRNGSQEPVDKKEFSSWDDNWDKRDPEAFFPSGNSEGRNASGVGSVDKKGKNKSISRHLFLIRHGHYYIDRKDKGLTDLGRKQAELCGQRLSDLGFQFTRFVSSKKQRAVETASIISQFVEPDNKFKYDSLLNEGSPVRPDPVTTEAARKEDLSYYEDGPRIEAAFRRYFHRPAADQTADSYEILVCHANVIRYFVCRALQIQCSAWLRMSIAHCSITWVKISGNGHVRLRTLGDSGFMPADMVTY